MKLRYTKNQAEEHQKILNEMGLPFVASKHLVKQMADTIASQAKHVSDLTARIESLKSRSLCSIAWERVCSKFKHSIKIDAGVADLLKEK